MIDTHAHLNLPEYLQRIDEVIVDSRQAGLTGIVVASANLEESKKSIELSKRYPDYLHAMVGIHPQNTNPNFQFSPATPLACRGRAISKQISQLDNLINENREYIVAVGETGLDDSEPPPPETKRSLEEQRELFKRQLSLAAKYDLPVIIHARGLVDEVIEMVSGFENCKLKIENSPLLRGGVFHCYAGGKKRIPEILDLPGNWYFGIDGNVTYDQGLQNVVAEIPQERLLLETDSPWLTPEPHRGEKNTPAYLPFIAAQIAEIWQTDVSEVDKITTENTQKLFNF